jgi:hypothetical protein
MIRISAVALVLSAGASSASFADEFPEGATPMQPAQVTQTFAGKVFTVKLKDGTGWRFDFRTGGNFYFKHSKGPTDTGEWRVEDSKLCTKGRKFIDPSCNEVRFKDDHLLFKRDNGDVVEFVEER